MKRSFLVSTKGSMKIAKNYDKKWLLDGVDEFSRGETSKSEFDKQFEGQAIGGDPEDVVYIGFALDIGDISGDFDGFERQNVFQKLWGRYNFKNHEQEQFFDCQRVDMKKLMDAAANGVPIRIWKSNSPYSTCGFYFICDVLRCIDCQISIVSLPEYKQVAKNEIAFYTDWRQIDGSKIYEFLPLEKQLSQCEKWLFGDHWRVLANENAPLRAVVNGKLISVPEDYYDFIIIKDIPDDTFRMARLIGVIMGKYQLGISDSWLAVRIEKMIEENKLMIVEHKDRSYPYGKILKKANYWE